MKYNELIQFEPITNVIKLAILQNKEFKEVAESLVKTYIFSNKMKEVIPSIILKNLKPDPDYETKGLQIVGSYGSGKSHLMSVLSLIAEDAGYLSFVTDENMKGAFKTIAGKYKVIRFESGSTKPLSEIIFDRIERYFKEIDIPFQFDTNSKLSWKEQLQEMMATFEENYPDKHLLILIDELLEFLKSKNPTELNKDLMMLRQLGELCDRSRFKIIFGVQELLYRSSEFQHQADMLSKVEDRYDDLVITKEDISFVAKERLLKKDLSQKSKIKEHLLKFSHLFDGIHSNLNEYVELFPVHPSYISHFERIKHGKKQREILKVLGEQFHKIGNTDVPANSPGLITIDSYWEELSNRASEDSRMDIRTVKDNRSIIQEAIDKFFVSGRKNKKELANKIADALCIIVLSDDLHKKNGAEPLSLKEDLCVTISSTEIDSSDLLLQNVKTVCRQLVTATSGQYVDEDSLNGKFYIRTEGGINVPQIIKDYATGMIQKEPDVANQYYYDILQFILGLNQTSYRTNFKIWEHSLEWIDKKIFRLGYIFLGNPNERSTTEPLQQYYLFFSPIFSEPVMNDELDEVYFDMRGLSESFRESVYLYGASVAKISSASSAQKHLFETLREEYKNKCIELFHLEYTGTTKVYYRGEWKPLDSYGFPTEGFSEEDIFSKVASIVLNPYFNSKFPNFPAFTELSQPITKDNMDTMVKSALSKIVNSGKSNRNGEAMLAGLGLWNGRNIKYTDSKYANSILNKLTEKGEGKVLNREELIYPHYPNLKLYYSKDYNLDYPIFFIVLAALVYNGEIEVFWNPQKILSSISISKLTEFTNEDFFTFSNIKRQSGLPERNIVVLFECLGLPNLISDLQKDETITQIITKCKQMVDRVLRTKELLNGKLKCRDVSLLSEQETEKYKSALERLASLLDQIMIYNTFGTLKNFRFKEEELRETFKAYAYCDTIDKLKNKAEKFQKYASYLYRAQSYILETEPLYQEIRDVLSELDQNIVKATDNELIRLETKLQSLIENYADYYSKEYAKYRLSKQDTIKKEALLESEKKKICDVLKDIDIINPIEYTNWIKIITSLKPIDIHLNKEKIKQEPYHNFSPKEHQLDIHYNMEHLESQLNDIYIKWESHLHSLLKDPGITNNLDLLIEKDKNFMIRFINKEESLTPSNSIEIRKLILELTKGLEKLEVSAEEILKIFQSPKDPDDMVKQFEIYIYEKCQGRDRKNIRILVR